MPSTRRSHTEARFCPVFSKQRPPTNIITLRAHYADPIKRGQKQGASGDVLARCKTAEAQLTALLDKVVLTVSQSVSQRVEGGVGALFFCRIELNND